MEPNAENSCRRDAIKENYGRILMEKSFARI